MYIVLVNEFNFYRSKEQQMKRNKISKTIDDLIEELVPNTTSGVFFVYKRLTLNIYLQFCFERVVTQAR